MVVVPSDIIDVQPMEEVHAITLFEMKLGKQSGSKDVVELVGASLVLEFMLLTIANRTSL